MMGMKKQQGTAPDVRAGHDSIFGLEGTRRKDLLFFIVLLTAHIGLAWWVSYFPTQDGPSHLYNLAILRDLVHDGGATWGQFLTYRAFNITNNGFNAIAMLLVGRYSPFIIEKIFISLYVIMTTLSCVALMKSLNKPLFPVGYLILPVLYNLNLMMGFYSYAIAVPVLILALAFQLRGITSYKLDFLISNLFGFLLFYLHSFAFCLFLAGAIVITLGASWYARPRRFASALPGIVKLIPCLAILVFYLATAESTFVTGGSLLSSVSGTMSVERSGVLLAKLFLFSLDTFSPLQLLPISMLLFVVILCFYNRLKNLSQTDVSVRDKVLILVVVVFVLFYFVLPFRIGNGSFINERLLFVVYLLLLPLLEIPRDSFIEKYARVVFLTVTVVFFVTSAGVICHEASRVEMFMAGLNVNIPKSSFVMGYKRQRNEWSRVDPLLHASSYYGLSKKCVDVGNYEADKPYFPIAFKHEAQPLPDADLVVYYPETIDMSLYPHITYIIGYRLIPEDEHRLNALFTTVMRKDNVTVWKRRSL